MIGLFVGISLILNGWSLMMLSAAVRNLPVGALRRLRAQRPKKTTLVDLIEFAGELMIVKANGIENIT